MKRFLTKRDYEEEIWMDIHGYEGKYQVSNLGRVKSLDYNRTGKEQILRERCDRGGYPIVHLRKQGKGTLCKIHRLMLLTFIGPPPFGLFEQVNHKDENKTHNYLFFKPDGCIDEARSNLEWCTTRENHDFGTRNERAGKANTNGKRSKKVLQYDLNGNFIAEWPSASEPERQLGYLQGNISNCCRGKSKSAYGYIWKYA